MDSGPGGEGKRQLALAQMLPHIPIVQRRTALKGLVFMAKLLVQLPGPASNLKNQESPSQGLVSLCDYPKAKELVSFIGSMTLTGKGNSFYQKDSFFNIAILKSIY